MTSTCASSSIRKWLADALENRSGFLREDLDCDCIEILNITSINPEEPHEKVERKDELLVRLDQWQRDKEFLGLLDLHIIVARHIRKCFRASGDGDFLDAWKHHNVKLDGKALADELESIIGETLLVHAPSATDAREKFKTELCLTPGKYFQEGLERLIGFPSLNVNPMEAMKAEHEDDKPFCNKENRPVDPRKEWNIVVGSGLFKIDAVGCEPDFPIKGRDVMHDLEHYVRLAGKKKFRGVNLNRAEITALRLWTGPMHSKYAERIREHINVEGNIEKDAGHAFEVRRRGYVNTLHAINSGITKLARIWKVPRDRKVYRGYDNLKMQELERDFGCMGGVESSFLATSEKLDVAICYSGDGAFILEINVGQVNKGADISWLSQFPHEKEILFNALSNVDILGSPQLRFFPKKAIIKVYRVQISSNTRSRTLDEFENLRKGLHLNMAEVVLTQANRMISDHAEASAHGLVKDLCLKCKEHSQTIFQRGKKSEASMFNKGIPEYLRLVEEVIMFQESSLTLVELATNWFKEESAHLEYMVQLQLWQLDLLRAAFKDNQRPCVKRLTTFEMYEQRERILETSIFDKDLVDLGQVQTRSTLLAVGKLLSLNPSLTALYLKADWATIDVWEDVFKVFQRREGRFTINEFEVSQYAIPSLRRLEIRYARGEMAKMIGPALQIHPPTSLTCLNLCKCTIGCAGAESLARSFKCLQSLTYLSLIKCGLGDRGCAALARNLTALDRLKGINLSHNVIENQDLLLLASTSTSLIRLEFVDVRFNANELRPSQLKDSSRIRTNIIRDFVFDSEVLCVAWSPEGSKAAAACDDSVIIHDANSSKEITKLLGHSSTVLCIAWSPAGSMIASGSKDMTMIIWDAETGKQKFQLEGHTDDVYSVCWSPEGSKIASGSWDRTVIIWDAVSGKQKSQLKGHTEGVLSVAWSPDGSKIASGHYDCAIIIWDVETGEQQAQLQGHTNEVTSVSWSPQGSKIASGSGDKTIIVWDAQTGQQKLQLQGHSGSVWSVSWSPEGSKIVSGGGAVDVAGEIIIWDATTGEQKCQLKGHTDRINSVAWSPGGSMIASGSKDTTEIIWDVVTGQQNSQLKGHSDSVWSVAWSSEGTKIASGSLDKTIIIWDAETREQKTQLKGHIDSVLTVAWSPEGDKLASGSGDTTIIIWDAVTGEQKSHLKGHASRIQSVAWSPEGDRLVSGSFDKTVIIWDAESGEQKTLEGHNNHVNSVAWSPWGSLIASGSTDKSIIIWDAMSGEQKSQLKWHCVYSVAWSPDCSKIASGSPDNTIIIWDVMTEERKSQLKGHSHWIHSVAWSPDGSKIASGSRDKTIIIWDAQTGEQITQLKGHTEGVLSVAWSPGGSMIASGSTKFDKSVDRSDDCKPDETDGFESDGTADSLGGDSGSDGSDDSESDDKTLLIWDA